MSVAMPGPWKHPTTSTYYLKQRVPADLVKTAAGTTVVLPVDGITYPVKVGDQVKVSLRTKDPRVAKERHREADEALSLQWRALRSAPVELTHKQLLGIAGEIYRAIVADFDEDPQDPLMWDDAIRTCADAGASPPPSEVAQEVPEEFNVAALELLIRSMTEEILAKRGLRLSDRSRDNVRLEAIRSLANAFSENLRKAGGDYSPSPITVRYPPLELPTDKPEACQDSQSVSGLFEVWKAEREREGRSGSTAARWSAPIRDFVKFLEHDDAGRVRPEDIVRWREAVLATGDTIPRTFNRVHLCAVRSIFNEGRGKKLTTNNPTEGLSFRASKARQSRPKGFVEEEAVAILRAADRALEAPGRTSDVMRRVQRWVPWLCAYTGARVGEMTQLRKEDVMTIDGIACLRISPEAGTVKTGVYRDVPLHSHLIDMGFLDFVAKQKSGPLFYSTTMQSKTPWSIIGNKLAAWVREVAGVTDLRVKPNHGWRHAFQTTGRGAGIDQFYRNGICGQTTGNAGDNYGDTPMSAVKREIERLPRWNT